MKKIIFSISFFTIILAAASPALVFAAGQAAITINPNIPGLQNVLTAGPCGWIVNFYTFALIIAGILAFGAIVYGGFLYATSAGNPSKQSEGRSWIWSALLGVLLLGGAYLILYTINPNLTKCSLPALSSIAATSGGTSGGTGGGNPFVNGGSSGSGGAGATDNFSGGGAIPSSVAAAVAAYQGADTSGGPGNGTVACAWAVNNVLANAGIAPLDSTSVQSMENALTSGRGTLVDSSAAVPGDIVIQAQDGHVGVCLNNGCTQVLSNSSSKSSFSWVSDTSFSPSYSAGPGRIYQIKS